MRPDLRCATLVAALLCVLTVEAGAHTRSESHSVWSQRGSAVIGTVTVPAREATRLPGAPQDPERLSRTFAEYLATRASVTAAETACMLAAARPLRAREGYIRVELRFDCGAVSVESPIRLRYLGLIDLAPSHVHFARARTSQGGYTEFLFTADRPEWTWPAGPADTASDSSSASFGQYLRLGVDHIATGIDHIAFLLVVMLVARYWRPVLIAVTGFTLGHSLTLSVAVLGWVRPDAGIVEALIGLTIALVAAEYAAAAGGAHRAVAIAVAALTATLGVSAWVFGAAPAHLLAAYLGMALFTGCYLAAQAFAPDAAVAGPWRHGLYVGVATFAFGLVHGFGFAGFLLETGLGGGSLLVPLIGFNLGVEAGQLVLVVLFAGAGLALRHVAAPLFPTRIAAFAPHMLAASLCALGTFWFVERTFA